MSTKDALILLKDKNQFFTNEISQTETRYSNFNLNQNNYKCSILIPVQSFSKLYNDKFFDSFKNSSKICNFKSFNNEIKEEKDKNGWQKDISSTKIDSSTISLHIAAYENSSEAVISDSFNDKNINGPKNEAINKLENEKQIFTAVSKLVIQNSFEFPRQQSDEISEPEVSQFKASQRLFSPNAMSSRSPTRTNKISAAVCTHTTIGKAFLETLNEALEVGVITENIAEIMQNIFEKSIWDCLKHKSKLKVVLHGSHLVGSRHIEGQWTLIKRNVSIKIGYRRPFTVEKLKIIAVPRRDTNNNNNISNMDD
uniref:Uncharacterized protein n=1 Tax=Panagrolaimus sp. PS1159 TaxID=55785 RepID=A0AC35GFS6_9BILA